MFRIIALFAVCGLSIGCSDSCGADELASGSAEAKLDGADWSVTQVIWVAAGSAVQVTTPAADGWRFSIVAQATAEQVTAVDALGTGEFPIEFPLDGNDSGGWALGYPDEGSSYSSEYGGGTLVIEGKEGEDLLGCFEFTAGLEGDTSAVEVREGKFRAQPM